MKSTFGSRLGWQPRVDLTNVNGTLFFLANDGVHGFELWKSNGTAAGTVLVADINPGATGSIPGNLGHLTNVNGTLFFDANDGTSGRGPPLTIKRSLHLYCRRQQALYRPKKSSSVYPASLRILASLGRLSSWLS